MCVFHLAGTFPVEGVFFAFHCYIALHLLHLFALSFSPTPSLPLSLTLSW